MIRVCLKRCALIPIFRRKEDPDPHEAIRNIRVPPIFRVFRSRLFFAAGIDRPHPAASSACGSFCKPIGAGALRAESCYYLYF